MRWQYALKTVVLSSLSPQEMREFEGYLQGFGDEGYEIVAFHLLPHAQGSLAVVLLKREHPRSGHPPRSPRRMPATSEPDESA